MQLVVERDDKGADQSCASGMSALAVASAF
jgi:diaminopimelate epimerase